MSNCRFSNRWDVRKGRARTGIILDANPEQDEEWIRGGSDEGGLVWGQIHHRLRGVAGFIDGHGGSQEDRKREPESGKQRE